MRGQSYSNNETSKKKDFRGGEIKVMNKKFIAIITALALVVTLLAPIGVQEASAATKNKIDRQVTVTKDVYLGDANNRAPILLVEVDDNGGWTIPANQPDVFRVQLPENVDWKIGTGNLTVKDSNGNVVNTATAKVSRKVTEQIIEVELTGTFAKGNFIEIPLIAELDGASGELRVTVIPMESRVSGGSTTFAVVQSGKTVATVGTKKTIGRGDKEEGATIVIDESTTGALSTGKVHSFKLKLPNNFEWSNDTQVMRPANLKANTWNQDIVDNGRSLEISFEVNASNKRESITIKPYIMVTRDAKYGEVTVDITNTKGDVSAQSGLLIAEYADYGVKISVEEVKEFLAGYEDGDEYRTAKIVIEETTQGSLVSGRMIEFELPQWAKIADKETIEIENKTTGATKTNLDIDYDSRLLNKTKHKFEVNSSDVRAGVNSNTKAKLEMTIPLSIEANKSGDVELTLKGAGIPEQTLVIAKAIAPVKAEVKVSDVKLGVQNQAAPDIIITESKAEAIRDGKLVLKFADGFENAFRFNKASFEVTEGDLVLSETGHVKSGNTLEINIKTESTKPSTIKVSGLELSVDRTAPEGLIKLDIGGSALVDNAKGDGDYVARVDRFDYANVVTPAPGGAKFNSEVTLTVGQKTMTVNGVAEELDVTPYIKSNRTYVPLRAIAQAFGAKVSYAQIDGVGMISITHNDNLINLEIGSKVMTINGGKVFMDVAPEITNGRTMLPYRYVAQALGANEVKFDEETQTITVK